MKRIVSVQKVQVRVSQGNNVAKLWVSFMHGHFLVYNQWFLKHCRFLSCTLSLETLDSSSFAKGSNCLFKYNKAIILSLNVLFLYGLFQIKFSFCLTF